MKQLIVGITGGIGCGMSEVARRLNDLGAAIVSVDAIGRKVVEKDENVLSQLKEAFGQQYFNADGKLDRKKLGKLVFSDQKAREKLDEIVHPIMIEKTKAQIEEHLKTGKSNLVVVDAALIYELNLDDAMDYTVVVNSSLELRRDRIRIRDGLSTREINNRIHAQMPLEEKIQRADYVVSNVSSLFDLDKKVQSLYRWLKVRIRVDNTGDS